jgi:hypothetical protein
VSQSYDLDPSSAPPLVSLIGDIQEETEKERQAAVGKGREGGGHWARSRALRLQKSLVLCKLFNTLWI